MRLGDLLWGVVLAGVIGLLVVRNFWLELPELGPFRIGPLRLSPFGIAAALDLLFGFYLVVRWCERFRLPWPTLTNDLLVIVAVGYVVSHLVSVALYSPHQLTDWRALVDYRIGISSFGGMFGGGAAALAVFARRGMPPWRYLDAVTLGFVGGYVFGRAGCFAIHDHPGTETDFLLGVTIDGVRRHDLGFYEMWLMLALTLAVLWLARRGRPPDGAVLALCALVYSPMRFAFDSLRVVDPVYAGLTPGQWMALPLFAIGLWRLIALRRDRSADGP